MWRALLIVFLWHSPVFAAGTDSLFVVQDAGGGWSIRHRIQLRETIISLSRQYHVPPTILSEANGRGHSSSLSIGSIAIVPVGPFNWIAAEAAPNGTSEAIFYRVNFGDDLYDISRLAGLSKRDLMRLNSLRTDAPPPGKVLMVGRLRYEAPPLVAAVPKSADAGRISLQSKDTPKYVLQPLRDTPALDPPATGLNPTLAQLWAEQTQSGRALTTEKVTAGFFNTGSSASMYAFYNLAARGAILKVENINNGKVIYVKVLGVIPTTQPFKGCSLGLSNAAKAALDVREQKVFCEISYAGY